MSSVELIGVTHRYRRGGVENLSLHVREGEIACLLGPSGSGKTTVLRLIAGFLKPQSGVIRIGDETVSDGRRFVPPQARGVGLVFQHHALFPHLTVTQNILFGCKRKDRQERQALLDSLLDDFGIAPHRHCYPHQISGGEQQRVALARAIASDPSLLLMDEPFSSLDAVLRQHVQRQCVQAIHSRGLTALIVTHDEQDASALGDRVMRLREGQLIANTTADPLLAFRTPAGKSDADAARARLLALPQE